MLNNKKSYAFDFDSNLVFTQDTIFLLKWNGKSWHKVEITQQEFDKIQIDNINRKWVDDNPQKSLENFIKKGNYEKALFEALDSGKIGPSWENFINANQLASPIAIITARGQDPDELKSSHRKLIHEILTLDQKMNLVSNMDKKLFMKLPIDEVINKYLDNNLYLPVESEKFLKKYKIGFDVSSSIKKTAGFEIFIRHVRKLFELYYGKKFINDPKFSIGFSDDNLKNLEFMIKFIKSKLIFKYPDVRFYIYDTNDSKNIKKIFIK